MAGWRFVAVLHVDKERVKIEANEDWCVAFVTVSSCQAVAPAT